MSGTVTNFLQRSLQEPVNFVVIARKVVAAFDGDRNDGKAIKYSFVPVNIDNLFNGVIKYLRLFRFSLVF